MQDVFPRSVGPNAKGGPAGGGAGFTIRILTTDKGVLGWCSGGGTDEEAAKFVGRRVGDLYDVDRGIADDVPWFLDQPLTDLAARILDLPVWRMIGAKGSREVQFYSGAIYFDDLMPQEKPKGVEGLLACCKQDYEAGYRAFKLKIGRGFKWMPKPDGLKRDIEVVRAVRQRFNDCKVLVDANDSYTVEEAVDFVKAVADCDLYWIEEPFEESRDDYKRLREAMTKAGCKAMICDGESRKDRAEKPTAYGGYTKAHMDRLFALAEEKLVDVFNMDLNTVGFSRWRRVMPDLVKAGVKASPHTWVWTARPYYAAQLASGAGNVDLIEGIPGRAKGLDYSTYQWKDGKVTVPDAPGFGIGLEPAAKT
jgi:L-alanine-DL-glutamate epimerase-like enolase superfamily enzyme